MGKDMVQLNFAFAGNDADSSFEQVIDVLNWFAVQRTTTNSTNHVSVCNFNVHSLLLCARRYAQPTLTCLFVRIQNP